MAIGSVMVIAGSSSRRIESGVALDRASRLDRRDGTTRLRWRLRIKAAAKQQRGDPKPSTQECRGAPRLGPEPAILARGSVSA